ncbi:syntaxin-22-like isoform X1 [Papaver somniferum]|uniref:syntaxin-22-like isoform X1 n=1 Tax=Papaver somniferum TaxID=3469 RepID=UPI000E6F7457|nr:syntaxin-22-like isoform X1 [Papaver somniferum]
MDFQATLQNYQKIQGLAIIGREANEQLRLGVVDPQSSSTFLEEQTRCSQETLMLENEIIFNEATIEERDECIRDIHSDIVEIHDIYRDLAVLIREQAVGDNIDSIAAAVKSTSKLQLVKAHKSVKCWSSRVNLS